MSGVRERARTRSSAAAAATGDKGGRGNCRGWGSSRRIGLVIALVLAGCALLVEDAAPASAASPSPSWSVAASYPAPVSSVNGAACPSASTCFAVGVLGTSTGSIDVTANGGTTWSRQTVPTSTGPLAGIACPTTSMCEAVGQSSSSRGTVLGTTNGGATWTGQSVPGASVALGGVACPSTSVCIAVGESSGGAGVVLSTTNAGTTWSARSLPGGTGSLASVSCPSTLVCTAVGGPAQNATSVTTSNGGVSWSAKSVPGSVGELAAVSCPTTALCEAVGEDPTSSVGVIVASVGGGPWTAQTVPVGVDQLSGVWCPTSSFCAAVGDAIITTTDAGAGATWNSQALPGQVNALAAVSCESATACEAGGSLTTGLGAVVGSTAPTTSWSNQTLPYAVDPFAGSACPSSSSCFAVGTDTTGGAIYSSTNGGLAWSKQSLPAGVGSVSGVGCANSTTCEAAGSTSGGGGAMLGTTDGATWSLQSVPGTVSDLVSVSCPSTSDCTAVGTDIAGAATIVATNDGGTTWNNETVPSGIEGLFGVACPTTSECVAVGSVFNGTSDVAAIITTSDSGVLWTHTSSVPSAGPLRGISCSTALNCVTVGFSFDGTTYTPAILSTGDANSATSTWSRATVPSGIGELLSVSCPTSIACEATGATTSLAPAIIATSDGTSWSRQQLPVEVGPFDTVSCPSSTACVGGGDGQGTTGGMLLSYSVPSPVAPAPFFPVSPNRICDTRPTSQSGITDQCTGNTFGGAGTLSVQVTGLAGVPSGATAAVANVTVTNATGAGYLTVYPAGTPRPLVSNVNFSAGQTVPNLVTVPLSPGGAIDIFNSTGSTDVLVDVTGYYAAGTGAGLVPLQPSRICDTRSSSTTNQCTGKSPGAGGNSETLPVQVTGQGGVASGATAVVANLTVVGPSQGGYLTVYPAGTSKPLASNVNFVAGATVPNRVIVPLSSTGAIDIFNSSGSSDVIVDVTGYFSPSSTGYFEALTPTRICDSRPASQSGITDQCTGKTLGAGGNSETLPVQMTGFGGVPPGAAAVVANVTATGPSATGYLTVYPAGTSKPLASDLNFTAGQTVANQVVADLGGSGGLAVFNASGSNDVIIDVAGWFT